MKSTATRFCPSFLYSAVLGRVLNGTARRLRAGSEPRFRKQRGTVRLAGLVGLTLLLSGLASACSVSAVGSLAVTGVPTTAAAGSTLDLGVVLQGAEPGTVVKLEVIAGGGSLSAPTIAFDEGGTKALTWTLGLAPVPQRLRVYVQGEDDAIEAEGSYDVDATRTTPLAAEPFGDVHAMLTAAKRDGSTEDLAFSPSGQMLVMGVSDGLLKVSAEGKSSLLPTTGDAIIHPLGLAYDANGRLWICDSQAHAIKRMDKAGVVSTIVTEDDGAPLGSPNHLAVLSNGDVIFSDPCLGKLVWVDGKTGKTKGRHTFDLANEGGPNGVAVSPDGETLFVATENTALLCGHTAKLTISKNVAGLYKLPVKDGTFGSRTAIVEGMGLFGDGLAFDAEGNLYVCLDRVKDLKLQESAVEVLPKGGTELRPFLSAADRIFANVLFAPAPFGATRLYIALLAVPPFTDVSQRGLMRVNVGIGGAPLGHEVSAGK